MDTPQPSGTINQSEVYKQRSDDHRFYGDMRFKQLTLWSGATALLINAGFSDKGALSLAQHPAIVPLFGALLTMVFWIMEVRSTVQGVEALEAIRGYWDLLPNAGKTHWTFINHTNATLLLYFGSFLIWGRVLDSSLHWISVRLTLVGTGTLLLIYTSREYFELWKYAAKNWKR